MKTGMPGEAAGRWAVVAFALIAALLILLSAYATDRNGTVDEPGFLNAPYMLAHYGHLAFPAYPYSIFFDLPVITHPPVHLGWVGWLLRFGLPFYYAEATPTVLLFLLLILVVVVSPFPLPVRLGWLFAIAFFGASGETLTICFGARPEGELLAAWLIGLLLLESGRLAAWDPRRLFAGAFFLTWAAGVHYYAGPAPVGVLVYMVWAIHDLGWKSAKKQLFAIVAGGCLFGIPYLAFYMIPYLPQIRESIQANLGTGGSVAVSIRLHKELYQVWAATWNVPALIRLAVSLGIPLAVFSTAILAAIRTTRGVALAALPMPVGIFFLAWHKDPNYLIHESVFFAGAVAIGLLVVAYRACSRFLPAAVPFFGPVAAILMTVYLAKSSPMLPQVHLASQPMVLEMEISHAAGRRMLGPRARGGGQWWSWYASGAEHWYDVERDDQTLPMLLPAAYVANIDAIEDCQSGRPLEHFTTWYADGILKLRGFYFAQTNPTLSCAVLGPQRPSSLTGFAMRGGQLYRFHEDTAGDYAVVTAACPQGADQWGDPDGMVFEESLPLDKEPAGSRLLTILARRGQLAPAGPVAASCREIARTLGTLSSEDWRSLVAWSRASDPLIRFYHNVEELPGFAGMGVPSGAIPPADAVKADGIEINLQAIETANGSRVERVPQIQLSAMPPIGAFAALLPVKTGPGLGGPGWIVLKLRVRSGRIAFGAYSRTTSQILTRSGILTPSPEAQLIGVRVDDVRAMTDVLLFNGGSLPTVVEILDATVLRTGGTRQIPLSKIP